MSLNRSKNPGIKISVIFIGKLLYLYLTVSVIAEESDLAERINGSLKHCAENENYHVTADQLFE